MAGLLATGLDAVNRYRKVEEATAPRDDPAPVYLLDEIADMSRQSPEAAQALADAVQKKLAAKNPVVKFKALRVIKHLCTKGCSQFQRCMQRHSQCVRELLHWRGEPDPFKGDVPNARVREFAKEVVEVMFNATPVQPSASANTLAAQGKIQGFGSGGEAMAAGGSGSSSTGSRGIGSADAYRHNSSMASGLPTSFAGAQRAASQLTQAAQQALGEGPLAQGIANAFGGLLNQPTGYSGRLNDSGYRDYSPEPAYSSSGGAAGYAAPTISQAAASQVLGGEEGLVEDITAPGGLRPLPDAADLRRFVDSASSMDGLRIAELLRDKMESPRWQVVLRSLAALEAVLQRGSSQACGEVAVMFQSDPGPVRAGLQSPQPQVQRLAAAVLKHLTGEEVVAPATAAAAADGGRKKAAASAVPVADLLIDDAPPSTTAAGPAAAPAAAAGGIDDLLGGFAEPAPAAAPTAAAAAPSTVDSLFDGLGVQGGAAPAAAAAAGDSSGGDMFGGLTVAEAPPPAAAAAAHPAAAPPPPAAAAAAGKQSAPLDELFSGLTTSPAQASSSSLLSHHQQPQPGALAGATDLLGSGLGLVGAKQQQPAAPFVALQQPQYNMHQQQLGGGGGGGGIGSLPGGLQQLSLGSGAGGAHSNGHHGPAAGGSSGGASSSMLHKSGSNAAAWSGHDDVSNLLRQVGHGGKYDPAFDFVTDEFSSASGGKR